MSDEYLYITESMQIKDYLESEQTTYQVLLYMRDLL